MTTELPPCPECGSVYTYEDGALYICPECAHEWPIAGEDEHVYRDVVGNILEDGDTVTIAKDLKVGNKSIKVGTKVRPRIAWNPIRTSFPAGCASAC